MKCQVGLMGRVGNRGGGNMNVSVTVVAIEPVQHAGGKPELIQVQRHSRLERYRLLELVLRKCRGACEMNGMDDFRRYRYRRMALARRGCRDKNSPQYQERGEAVPRKPERKKAHKSMNGSFEDLTGRQCAIRQQPGIVVPPAFDIGRVLYPGEQGAPAHLQVELRSLFFCDVNPEMSNHPRRNYFLHVSIDITEKNQVAQENGLMSHETA